MAVAGRAAPHGPPAAAEPRLGSAAVEGTQDGDDHERRGEPGGGDADPEAVGAERCREDEQDAAGDDRLRPTVGPEREGVAQHRHEAEAERCGEQERALARDRGDGGGELAPHEAEIDPHELEGLAGGEQGGERVAVEEDGEQLEQHEQHDRHRQPSGHPEDAQHDAHRVHADHHHEQRVEELPVGEHPAHRDRRHRAQQRDRHARDHVVDVARPGAPHPSRASGGRCRSGHAGSR